MRTAPSILILFTLLVGNGYGNNAVTETILFEKVIFDSVDTLLGKMEFKYVHLNNDSTNREYNFEINIYNVEVVLTENDRNYTLLNIVVNKKVWNRYVGDRYHFSFLAEKVRILAPSKSDADKWQKYLVKERTAYERWNKEWIERQEQRKKPKRVLPPDLK